MLGDILITTQLLVTHLVTTFLSAIITTLLEYTWRVGSSNKMSILYLSVSVLIICRVRTERENMLILFLGITRTHRISPMTIAMITG